MQDNKPVELNQEQFIQKDVSEAEESILDKTDTTSEKNNSLKIVDSIESQIAAFEEDLALQCPLCKQSKVQAEQTSMGKTFYRCLTENCNFISWGKPYHIPCPQCNNPFLVETSDKTGKTILKCPRSTCIYRQNLPWELKENNTERIKSVSHGTQKITPISKKPRKRVKKRRVVRRKK
jgi:ssDNA-binding Zn-finger/Zn-ribbon topoisomerase 1